MSTLASDAFTRADAATLGANWTNQTSMTGWGITSNRAVCKTSSAFQASRYSGTTWPNDQWAQSTVISHATTNTDGGPAVRMSTSSAQTFYFADINDADSGSLGSSISCSIHKCVAGAFSAVGSSSSFTVSANDVIYIEVQGTSLVFKLNGVTKISGTDSSIASGAAGLAYWGGAANSATVDDWSGGDFAGGSSPFTWNPLTAPVPRRAPLDYTRTLQNLFSLPAPTVPSGSIAIGSVPRALAPNRTYVGPNLLALAVASQPVTPRMMPPAWVRPADVPVQPPNRLALTSTTAALPFVPVLYPPSSPWVFDVDIRVLPAPVDNSVLDVFPVGAKAFPTPTPPAPPQTSYVFPRPSYYADPPVARPFLWPSAVSGPTPPVPPRVDYQAWIMVADDAVRTWSFGEPSRPQWGDLSWRTNPLLTTLSQPPGTPLRPFVYLVDRRLPQGTSWVQSLVTQTLSLPPGTPLRPIIYDLRDPRRQHAPSVGQNLQQSTLAPVVPVPAGKPVLREGTRRVDLRSFVPSLNVVLTLTPVVGGLVRAFIHWRTGSRTKRKG